MASSTQQLLLKVLSGSQLGAEAGLPTGSAWTLGRDESCDIVLSDVSVAPHHAKLSVSATGEVALEEMEGRILIDGKPASTPRLVLQAFQVFTLGSTHFATGPASADWPPFRLPTLRNIGIAPLKVAPAPAGGASAARKKRRLPALAVVMVLVCLGAIGYAVIANSKAPTPFVLPGQTSAGIALDKSQKDIGHTARAQILAEVPGAQVDLSYRDGRPALRVYVEDDAASNKVRKIVNQLPEPVFLSTLSRSQLSSSLKVFLNANRITTLTPAITPPAKIGWTGYLKSRADWSALKKMLSVDFPGFQQGDDGIVFGEDLLKNVSRELGESGFSDSVSAKVENEGIRIEGSYAPERQEEWNASLSRIKASVGSLTPVLSSVTQSATAPSKDFKLDSPIVAVNIEGLPYIQLANGAKLYEGARVGDGFVLHSVSATTIVFGGPLGRREIALFQGSSDNGLATAKEL
jgi:type III secretion system YscD/HrpQ family protein